MRRLRSRSGAAKRDEPSIKELRREALEQLAPLATAAGFHPVKTDDFVVQLDDGIVGGVSIADVVHPRQLAFQPAVYLLDAEVSRLAAELLGDPDRSENSGTVSRAIGYTMPHNRFETFTVARRGKVKRSEVKRLARAMRDNALPYLRRYGSRPGLLEHMVDVPDMDQKMHIRPVLMAEMGDVVEATRLVDRNEHEFGGKWQDYHEFAARFRQYAAAKHQ